MSLYNLSQSEKLGIAYDDPPDFSFDCLQKRHAKMSKNNITDVFEHIWRGSMPQVPDTAKEYCNSYAGTYITRDAADLGGASYSLCFGKFLIACTALISEQVNYKMPAVITIDAMGTQTETAQQIIRQKGDYVPALKGNQPSLRIRM